MARVLPVRDDEVEAADGRAALEPTGPFDVALLDAHLGTESADDDLVARLRTRAQRIVAVTGDPSTRLHVDHVLRKPFDVEELRCAGGERDARLRTSRLPRVIYPGGDGHDR